MLIWTEQVLSYSEYILSNCMTFTTVKHDVTGGEVRLDNGGCAILVDSIIRNDIKTRTDGVAIHKRVFCYIYLLEM